MEAAEAARRSTRLGPPSDRGIPSPPSPPPADARPAPIAPGADRTPANGIKYAAGQAPLLPDDSDAPTKIERHSLGMFGLASGVWLGDTFVREAIPTSLSCARALRDDWRRNKKGLSGKKGTTETNTPKKGRRDSTIKEDRFATWNVGVQKVALRFDWDYREGILQLYTYSKVMGACTSLSSMAKSRATSRGPELIETCRNEEAGGDEGRLGYGRGCLHRRARGIELLPYTAIHDLLEIGFWSSIDLRVGMTNHLLIRTAAQEDWMIPPHS